MDAPRKPTTSTLGAGAAARAPTKVRVGYLPLTDCASVLMAGVLGFDRQHGVELVPVRVASWAGVRDKLLAGDLNVAHALYGLVLGAHLGIGGPQRDMAVLMTLDRNGQGITLSRQLAGQGVVELDSLAREVARGNREYTFAQTFPTGTHAMWLYYWLASAGIDPLRDTRVVTVPPPQMVTHLRSGIVDGFSVGEPWNACAVLDGVGVSVASSQEIWQDHPEKVLGGTAAFVDARPETCRAVIRALLETSRWIDASAANKRFTAETLACSMHLGLPVRSILPRLHGAYRDGLGRDWADPDPVRFFDDGAVNFPYLSDAMWFLTQYRRWGLLAEHPDYEAVARRVNRIELYRDAAAALGVDVPHSPMRSSRLIDGVVWDGSDPAAYADGFKVRRDAAVALGAA